MYNECVSSLLTIQFYCTTFDRINRNSHVNIYLIIYRVLKCLLAYLTGGIFVFLIQFPDVRSKFVIGW